MKHAFGFELAPTTQPWSSYKHCRHQGSQPGLWFVKVGGYRSVIDHRHPPAPLHPVVLHLILYDTCERRRRTALTRRGLASPRRVRERGRIKLNDRRPQLPSRRLFRRQILQAHTSSWLLVTIARGVALPSLPRGTQSLDSFATHVLQRVRQAALAQGRRYSPYASGRIDTAPVHLSHLPGYRLILSLGI